MQGNKSSQPQENEKRITNALKGWYAPGSSGEELLADYLTVQEAHLKGGESRDMPVRRSTTNQVLFAAINELEKQNSQLAQVLRLRFIDKDTLWVVANKMALSEQSVSRLQKKAIGLLAAHIGGREEAMRLEWVQRMEAGLPPASYTRLFGVSAVEEQLIELLLDGDGPAVMAVVGLGGIGKTALTDLVVRRMIRRFLFEDVIWLRIEHQTMSGRSQDPELTFENLLNGLLHRIWPEQAEVMSPQQRLVSLRQEFESRPYLIVIDNLEHERDSDFILDQLHSFARPTKFLLTSRSRLAKQSAVYNIPLQELPQAEALDFVRYHALECGVEPVAGAADKELAPIYETAGGNPLALKLIISLLDVLPLAEILADMTKTSTNPIQDMYSHIYRQSWRTLSEDGRTLLQAMPLVSESGGTADYLMTVSGLSRERLWPAIHELYGRSLIEVRGTIQDKRYGIHRLTNAFLCAEILQMPEWI